MVLNLFLPSKNNLNTLTVGLFFGLDSREKFTLGKIMASIGNTIV